MSSETALRVRGLSKCYMVYDRPQDRLKQMLVRGRRRYFREFWALRHVDLEVMRGETVGIVGRNGSGKTTLLELITGTLAPTEGSVEVHGRVAALLGLGAGFNPEFTGRENVALNAALLGLEPGEVVDALPAIEAFADIGEFVDRPVKTYSSGMYSRLAFAVAIHVQPDVLIVDETLSVGDEAFQRKCFARIEDLKERGCTILFVTHSAPTVVELCDRALLLDHGERLLLGKPKAVVAEYQRLLFAPPERIAELRDRVRRMDQGLPVAEEGAGAHASPAAAGATEDDDEAWLDPGLTSQSLQAYPERGARIRDVRIETPGGRRVNHLSHGRQYVCRYRVAMSAACGRTHFGMQIRSVSGVQISGQLAHAIGDGVALAAGDEVEVSFPFHAHLIPGVYFVTTGAAGTDAGEVHYLHRLVDVLPFRVLAGKDLLAVGLVNLSAGPARVEPAKVEADS